MIPTHNPTLKFVDHEVLSEFIHREREFTGDVSHELRTPLTILKGNVQICQARYGNDRPIYPDG